VALVTAALNAVGLEAGKVAGEVLKILGVCGTMCGAGNRA